MGLPVVEPLIGAISGLGTAISGLGVVLWRLNHGQRANGQHQDSELRLLREIRQVLFDNSVALGAVASAAAAAAASQAQVATALSTISGAIEYLKGRDSAR